MVPDKLFMDPRIFHLWPAWPQNKTKNCFNNVHPKLLVSLSLPLLSLCPQLKNRLTYKCQGQKQVGKPHILREGENSLSLIYVRNWSAFCLRFSPSILVCWSTEKKDRNMFGSSSHGATTQKMMPKIFFWFTNFF